MSYSDDELRSLWRSAGGSFHGPNVEHGTMPEDKLLSFLRSVIDTSIRAGLEAAAKVCEDYEKFYQRAMPASLSDYEYGKMKGHQWDAEHIRALIPTNAQPDGRDRDGEGKK